MTRRLIEGYRGLVCDLDGVVYRGGRAVQGAAESLTWLRDHDVAVLFATNNASRPPERVAEALQNFGVRAGVADVLTSATVGARLLRRDLPPGARVLAIGGPGVSVALRGVGLAPVTPAEVADGDPLVAAVLQGYGSQVDATDLAEAAYAVQRGARWVATNVDRTLPTDRGVAPGNGTLVDAVAQTTDVQPEVVGKPGPLMYEQAAGDLGLPASGVLAVGDRLETDIAGAHAAGMDALHVLTGVHTACDLVAAPARLRPRFIGDDLRALLHRYDEPRRTDPGRWSAGELTAELTGSGLSTRVTFSGTGSGSPEHLESIVAVRLALTALWAAQDAGTLTADQAVAALPPEAVA